MFVVTELHSGLIFGRLFEESGKSNSFALKVGEKEQ